MKMIRTVLALAVLFFCAVTATADTAGFQIEKFLDGARNRPMLIDWWYPVASQPVEEYNYGFGRGRVVESGRVLPGQYPLLLLSHGAMGSARNYSWIGEALARSGFLVAGISHYGESYVFGPKTIDPTAVVRMWERPLDVSAALSHIVAVSPFGAYVDKHRIAFIGHSSGGATALSLAGFRYDSRLIDEYCQSEAASVDRGCGYGEMTTPEVQESIDSHSGENYADARIGAFVAIDPAVGPGFYQAPQLGPQRTLMIAASVDNDFLPFSQHAGRVAGLVQGAETYWFDEGEGHFVYLDQCELDIEANGVPLCEDRIGVVRGDVHRVLGKLILDFLQASFSAQPANN